MPTSRLTFLYPHLFKSTARWTEPAASQVSHSIAARGARRKPQQPHSFLCQQQQHGFTTPSVGRQAAFAKRAGKGVEPLPAHETADLPPQKPAQEGQQDGVGKQDQEKLGKGKQDGQQQDAHHKTIKPTTPSQTQGGGPIHDPPPPPPPQADPNPSIIELPPPSDIDPITQTKKGSPMDEILHMGPPPSSDSQPDAPKSPITPSSPSEPPPSSDPTSLAAQSSGDGTKQKKQTYIHHFDSYSLVKHLSSPDNSPNYTLPQSIALMKTIRALLAHNLDNAQSGLVSRSDVDNETYLFRAACSELSTEVRKNRRVADEQSRQQRTHLQHEVDILTQRLNQDLLTLTDSVRGMFNDRKMAVREEQKAMESRIQQINYKISVDLNSESKSEIEEVRWILIRRSVLGIIFMAMLTLGTLRYATYVNSKRKREAEQRAKEEEEVKRSNGMKDHSPAPEAAQILAAS
ncbi:hypothetical protein QBC40DRAFT_98045 [Triangularia verruculosa]|uniref:MOZ protein represents a chromatin-associated acetyltransferase n=1 Tax=Triangularia verruculosa TaxID=2587418 RepID=A0AAN7AZ83_9PEZI|nr:hypothetical protein QBC40DRAFT_98045 [Triangularia verruculosa]